ncbi:MAG: cyclic nucleotide-binding domain-containing protein [Humidesulfovibrio sp.]|nr:cyclic nucleotide-binding domain-containing protein [Humidesulfovibrio sp.]
MSEKTASDLQQNGQTPSEESPQAPAGQKPPSEAQAKAPEGQKPQGVKDPMALLAQGLKKLDTFRLFSEEEIQSMFLPTCTVKSFKAGERIVREGEKSQVYFMVSGHVKSVKHGVMVSQMHRRGDVFGEEAVIDDAVTPETIIAVKDTTCLIMASKFPEVIANDALIKFYGIIYRVFAEKLVGQLQDAHTTILKLKEDYAHLQAKCEAATAEQPGKHPDTNKMDHQTD